MGNTQVYSNQENKIEKARLINRQANDLQAEELRERIRLKLKREKEEQDEKTFALAEQTFLNTGEKLLGIDFYLQTNKIKDEQTFSTKSINELIQEIFPMMHVRKQREMSRDKHLFEFWHKQIPYESTWFRREAKSEDFGLPDCVTMYFIIQKQTITVDFSKAKQKLKETVKVQGEQPPEYTETKGEPSAPPEYA